MNTPRQLQRIVATTDVHSAFGDAPSLLAFLHHARSQGALLVDCGDYFEGRGYHQLGHGQLETAVLSRLYDVIAPGNHGWARHLAPPLHAITVCANATGPDGPLFRPVLRTQVAGRRVAITGIIGEAAFDAIRVEQKRGHRRLTPATALTRLHGELRDEVDTWVVLSHSGLDEDRVLAAACPWIDVIFAGHCDSTDYGPHHIGSTLIVKGRARARGYALAEPTGDRWRAASRPLPTATHVPGEVADLVEDIDRITRQLTTPLGPLPAPWAHTIPDRHQLMTAVARRLHREHRLPVVLTTAALRPHRLATHLRLADLLAFEPFANQLVTIPVPDYLHVPGRWHQYLTHISHPDLADALICDPLPAPDTPAPHQILTQDYLAATFFDHAAPLDGHALAHAVRDALLAPARIPAPARRPREGTPS